MKTIFNIAKNELRQLFYSPIAWILIAIFYVQSGVAFSEVISMLLRYRSLGFGLGAVTSQIFMDAWSGIYPSVQGWLFLYVPLLTMGIISREKASGTDKLLLSSPVSEYQVVYGKFLAMAVCGHAMMSCLIIFIIPPGRSVKNQGPGSRNSKTLPHSRSPLLSVRSLQAVVARIPDLKNLTSVIQERAHKPFC